MTAHSLKENIWQSEVFVRSISGFNDIVRRTLVYLWNEQYIITKSKISYIKKITVVRLEIRKAVPKADISKFKVYLSKIYTMKLIKDKENLINQSIRLVIETSLEPIGSKVLVVLHLRSENTSYNLKCYVR